MRFSFNNRRRSFDRTLRKATRSYERKRVYELEKANMNNPTEFWHTITNLGPKKKTKIPWEVLTEDGSVLYETDEVLDDWKHEFENLLRAPPPANEE